MVQYNTFRPDNQVGGLTHLYSLVTERSGEAVAGASLSCVALGSLAGRFLGGAVLARVSVSAFFRLLLVVQSASLVVLAAADSGRVLLGASLLFGLTIGNVLLVHPLLLGETFGLRDFARVLSLSGLVATAGVTCGPLVVGLLRNASGGYGTGYLAAGSSSLLGAVLLHLTVRRGRGRRGLRETQVGVVILGTARRVRPHLGVSWMLQPCRR